MGQADPKARAMPRLFLLILAIIIAGVSGLFLTGGQGRIWPWEIHELSGMVASKTHADIFWVLNDSGNAARIYAIDGHGHVRARVDIVGAHNHDWEAISAGPCPNQGARAPSNKNCLYIGDIGDNFSQRTAIKLIALPEPDLNAHAIEPLATLYYRYGDGAKDCESLAIAQDGRFFLIEKWARGTKRFGLYSGNINAGGASAEQAAIVTQIGLIGGTDELGDEAGPWTDATLASDQQTLYLRDYRTIYRTFLPQISPQNHNEATYQMGNQMGATIIPDAALARLVLLGESLALNSDESALYYSSEGPFPPLMRLSLPKVGTIGHR